MNMNRRGFLSAMLAAGAYPLLPGCFSSKAYVANEKVRLAAIGCGAQAWFDLKKLAGNGDICEVVALCASAPAAGASTPASSPLTP